MINRFNGEYLFLSNFYEGEEFEYKGMKFRNSEAAFHSQKDVLREKEFEGLRPSDSKKLGRRVNLRNDWEDVKEQIMYDICLAKFSQSETLKEKLLNTGDKCLIEGNSHGDSCWGKIYSQKYNQWVGDNKLGKILMKIRRELSPSQSFTVKIVETLSRDFKVYNENIKTKEEAISFVEGLYRKEEIVLDYGDLEGVDFK